VSLPPRPAASVIRRRPAHRGLGKTIVGVVLTAIMLFPVYWMVNVSLTPQTRMRQSPPDWFPIHATFSGYQTVIREQGPYLGTSLLIGLGTVLLTLAIAAPAAFSIAHLRPYGGAVINFALLIAQMIPSVIMAFGFYSIFLSSNVVNHWWGLILADSTLAVPFSVLILRAFMLGIPTDLLQAARLDGAGPLRTFWSIVLPISRNGLVTAALFSFLWAWSDFVFANTLDNGGSLRPVTLGIYKYIGNNNQEWNAIMATAVVASIPAAVLLVLAQRYIAAGVTAGAVKD
jgi:multiple sugar transport system permease protein